MHGVARRSGAAHIELHITELAGPARSLDLEDSFPVSVHDGEPGIDKTAVLLDVANGSARRRLDLHFLQAAEAAPGIAPIGTYQVDHLQGIRMIVKED